MTTTNSDVNIRYVLDVLDRGLAKALALTRDMGTETKETSAQVEASAKLQGKQWDALASIATRAETAIAKAAITRSDIVDKSLDKQIAKQREMGASYDAIIAKQREAGASAAALAGSVERSAAKELAALQGVRREIERPVRRGPVTGGESPAGAARGGLSRAGTIIGVAGIAGVIGAEGVNSAVEATVTRQQQAQTLALAGVSNTHAQALAAGAQALGVPQQTLGVGIKTLAQKSTAALRPGPVSLSTVQPFLDLGVTKGDLQKDAGDTSKLLGDIADKLANAQKGSKAYADGTALLGKSFSTLHPLLEDGSKGLERNTQLAEKYGLITKGDAAKGVGELHEKQIELQFASMGLDTAIAKNLTPTLIKVLPVVAGLVHGFGQELKPAIHDVETVLGPVIKFFKDGGTEAKILEGILLSLGSGLLVVKAGTVALEKAQAALDLVMDANPVVLIVAALVALGIGLVEAYKHSAKFREIVGDIGHVAKIAGSAIKDGLGSAVDWTVNAFHNAEHFLSGVPADFKTAGHAIVDGFLAPFKLVGGAIVDIFKAEINAGISIIDLTLKGFNKVLGPHKIGIGKFSIHTPDLRIPLIPHLGTGGLMPAMVSPGELLLGPNGGAATVPGHRTASDSVFAMLSPGTKVMTDHGQGLMAAGFSVNDALDMQLPHFATGTGSGGFDIKEPAGKKPAKVNTYFDSQTGQTLHMTAAQHAAYVRKQEQASFALKHLDVVGKVSTFGPPGEPAHSTAYGKSNADPGIAINPTGDASGWNGKLAQSLAGKLFHLVIGSHSGNFRVIDKGPNSNGRKIDVTGAAAQAMGIDPRAFPTDSIAHASIAGSGFTATKAAKIPGLSAKTIGSPLDAFQAGFQSGLSGDSLSGSGLIGQAIKDVAVTLVQPTSAAATASALTGAGGSPVDRMRSFANKLDAMHVPYGAAGHSGWPINKLGEDCSSSVSKVLHSGGYLSQVLDTTRLPGALAAGPGKSVTVHDRALAGNAGHTIIELGGKFFGTSASNPHGGPGWIPRPAASYLSQLPTKLHPKGLRRGGIVGFQTGGVAGKANSVIGRDIGALTSLPVGTVDGSVGKTINSIGHWLDVANGLTNARLGQLESSLKSQIATLTKSHASPITIRRLASALNLVEGEVGRRVGALVKSVTDAQTAMGRQVSSFGRFQRLQAALGGSAADSVTGLNQAAQEQSVVAKSLQGNIATLQHALKVAQAHHDTKDIASITDQLNQAQDDLQEAVVTGVEDVTAAVAKAAQDAVDHASHNLNLATSGEQGFELQQQINGTAGTAAGDQAKASNIQGSILPAMAASLAALTQQQATAVSQGNSTLADQIGEAIAGQQNDILTEQLQALQSINDAAQDQVNAAAHGENIANLGEAHLELQQQLAGTFDTAGGGVERSDNITQNVIPAMEADLAALQAQQATAVGQGNSVLADQIGEAVAGKQNDILSEQLTAQQAIQANTESLQDFTGSTSVEFEGQQFTDLIGAGLGV